MQLTESIGIEAKRCMASHTVSATDVGRVHGAYRRSHTAISGLVQTLTGRLYYAACR